jgi:hypothetical protein
MARILYFNDSAFKTRYISQTCLIPLSAGSEGGIHCTALFCMTYHTILHSPIVIFLVEMGLKTYLCEGDRKQYLDDQIVRIRWRTIRKQIVSTI